MYEEKTDVYFRIRGINEYENKKRLSVLVRIPMSKGWIDDVKFIVFENLHSSSEPPEYLIKHKENRDSFAYFEEEVELVNNMIYGYVFSFKYNGNFMYVKNKYLISKDKISIKECWIMYLNSWTPEWSWIKERTFKNTFFINLDVFKSNINAEKAIFYPEANGNWCVRNLNEIMSVESFYSRIKTRCVSVIYLNLYAEDWIDKQTYKFIGDPYLETLCYLAHKSGMCVVVNILPEDDDLVDINEYLSNFYTLGVDRVDTEGLLSELMDTKDEIMLQ